jgi:hypothetical protein
LRHPSLYVMQNAFRQTPWETFAILSALQTLVLGLALALYPNIYTISKSYAVLSQVWPHSPSLGGLALLCALCVLLGIHKPIGRFGLLGILLFLLLIAVTSFLAVWISAGTAIYVLFFFKALYGFLQSGGIGHGRP